MHAESSDMDFVDGLFTVRAKTDWIPKDYEEREIPIPDFVVAALKERMLTTKSNLIFPTARGKLNGHMLRILKALAKRAGLNPDNCKLHTWRKTYATLQHKAGVDARTIQRRLGHSDLTTTLAYLEGEDARSERRRNQLCTICSGDPILSRRNEETAGNDSRTLEFFITALEGFQSVRIHCVLCPGGHGSA